MSSLSPGPRSFGVRSHSGTVWAGGGSPGGDAQLGGLCRLLQAQQEHVCGAAQWGRASATACPFHGSCIGLLYPPPSALGQGPCCAVTP